MNNSKIQTGSFIIYPLTLWNEKIRLFIGGRQAIARKYRSYHAVTSFYSIQTERSGDSLFIAQKYVKKSWARIFKRLWSPGIDSKEWIPPVYVAWRAVTITLFLLGS